MKLPSFALLAGLLLPLNMAASEGTGEISIGDTKEKVIEVLGKPSGYVGSPSLVVYYFDRGEVVFRNGTVQSHDLISSEEAEQKRAQRELQLATREAQREVTEQLQAEARQQRITEGTAIRDERRADPAFAALPPADRLAFWQVFRQRYPEVDVEFDYAVSWQQARVARAELQAEAERERRLYELERRVVDAEQQARLAEREAQRAQDRRSQYGYYNYPVGRHYPVVAQPCPPTRPAAPPAPQAPRPNVGLDQVKTVQSQIQLPKSNRDVVMRDDRRGLY